MRTLTDEEAKKVVEKLSKYIGDNVRMLMERSDGTYCFRLHKNRVYYLSEACVRHSVNIARSNLICAGVCFGKFTKGGTFRLQITALDHVAQYAKYKIWLKPGAEQSFLYGNHVLKSGLARITDSTPQYQGVIVYSMQDTPVGFGVTAKSTESSRASDPGTIVVFHQADIGEYLRCEDTLT